MISDNQRTPARPKKCSGGVTHSVAWFTCALQACLFVMVSPLEENRLETVSTLNFGSNARQVSLGQAKKHVRAGGDGAAKR